MKHMADRFESCLQASDGYLQVRSVLRQCSASVRKFIVEMEEEGLKAPPASEERERACAAIAAALLAHALPEGSATRVATKHPKMVLFAEQVKTLRKQKGLTQEELAHRVGLRQSTISMIENAQFRPEPTTIAKLAKQLGVPSEQLWPATPSGPVRGATNGAAFSKQSAARE